MMVESTSSSTASDSTSIFFASGESISFMSFSLELSDSVRGRSGSASTAVPVERLKRGIVGVGQTSSVGWCQDRGSARAAAGGGERRPSSGEPVTAEPRIYTEEHMRFRPWAPLSLSLRRGTRDKTFASGEEDLISSTHWQLFISTASLSIRYAIGLLTRKNRSHSVRGRHGHRTHACLGHQVVGHTTVWSSGREE